MKIRSQRRLLSVVIASAICAAAVLVPAAGASAMSIDCSYTPGLSAFVEKLKDQNLTCLQGGNPRGTTKGGGSTGDRPGNGIGAAAGSQVNACAYPTPDMPDWLYSNGTVTAEYLPPFYFPDPSGTDDVLADYRTEYRDASGTRFATRDYVVSTKRALTVPAKMYLHDFNLAHFPASVSQTWSCDHADWMPTQFANMSPTTGPSPVAPTGTDPRWSSSPLSVVSSIGPVPTRPGEFFYRVDATNTSSSRAYPALLSIDLSHYSIGEVISLPAGGSCPAWTPGHESCSATSVLPGQTITFTFLVKALSGGSTTLPLTTQVDTFANSIPNPRPFPSVLGRWTSVTP